MSDIDVGQALYDILSGRNEPPADAEIANLAGAYYRLWHEFFNVDQDCRQLAIEIPSERDALSRRIIAAKDAAHSAHQALWAALARRPDLIGE